MSSQQSLGLLPIYFVDCSSIMTLDGKHGDGSPSPFTDKERERIWQGIARLSREGRIKVVEPVKGELARYHPEGLERVKALEKHRLPPRSDALIRAYQEITGNHREMVRRQTANPGDPWIVAWARLWASRGVVVVTDETRRGSHVRHAVRPGEQGASRALRPVRAHRRLTYRSVLLFRSIRVWGFGLDGP